VAQDENPLARERRRALYREIVRTTDRLASDVLTIEARDFMRRLARKIALSPYALDPVPTAWWTHAVVNIVVIALCIDPTVATEELMGKMDAALPAGQDAPDDSPIFVHVLDCCGYYAPATREKIRLKKLERHAHAARESLRRTFTISPSTPDESQDVSLEEADSWSGPLSDGVSREKGDSLQVLLQPVEFLERFTAPLPDHVIPTYTALAQDTDEFDAEFLESLEHERMRVYARMLLGKLPERARTRSAAAWANGFKVLGLMSYASTHPESMQPERMQEIMERMASSGSDGNPLETFAEFVFGILPLLRDGSTES
jgi:hypothetical protein